MAAMAGHRIVDRRISDSGATEYRMRKGLVSDPLRENPEDDHWQSSTSLPAEQVAAAEEWLGTPQAPFEKPAAAPAEEEGRRGRRPESKRASRPPAWPPAAPPAPLTLTVSPVQLWLMS